MLSMHARPRLSGGLVDSVNEANPLPIEHADSAVVVSAHLEIELIGAVDEAEGFRVWGHDRAS